MGYLIHIVLALAVLGGVELAYDGEAAPPEAGRASDAVAVVGLALLPLLAGWLARRAALGGRFRTTVMLQGVTGWLPVVLFAVALAPLGWFWVAGRWAGARPGLLEWPHPALLLALAPFALYSLVAIDARARLYGPGRATAVRRFQLRMFASGFVPVAGLLLAAWVVGLVPWLRVHLEEVGLVAAGFGALLLGLFLWLLPPYVRHIWNTRPVPRGYQRDLLESVARHVGLRCRHLLVWDTENQMSNAAVIGLGPRRVVLLSDALLAELPPRELAAVFAHEAAHVKRHHVLVFLAWSIACFATADLVTVWSGVESELAAAAIVGGAFLLWYVAFGWLSRRFELEADLVAAETTRDPAALASALERVGSTHGKKSGWRHFGTDERIAFLREVQLDPGAGPRLKRRLRFAGRLGALAMVLAVGLELWTLVGRWDEDRLRVELRLGEYEAAAERLERLDPDAELDRALERALEVPEPRTVEALLEAAEGARKAGDERAAGALEGLARLRSG